MAFVQAKAFSALASQDIATVAVTLDSNTTTGNQMAVCVAWDSSAGTTAPTVSTPGNSFTQVGATINDATNNEAAAIFEKHNITGETTPTVTADWGGTTHTARSIAVIELSGRKTTGTIPEASTGQNQASPGTGTDGVTSGNCTTTTDGCDLVGFVVNTGALEALGQYTAGTGFVREAQDGSASAIDIAAEFKNQAAHSATTSATWTAGVNDATTSFVLAFAPSGGGGTTPSASDTATLSENTPAIVLSKQTDSMTLDESGVVSTGTQKIASDTGSLAEAIVLTAQSITTDPASLVDFADTVVVTEPIAEATLSEIGAVVSTFAIQRETMTLAEIGQLSVNDVTVASSDSATVTDAFKSLLVSPVGSDSATLVETGTVFTVGGLSFAANDAFGLSEIARVAVVSNRYVLGVLQLIPRLDGIASSGPRFGGVLEVVP